MAAIKQGNMLDQMAEADHIIICGGSKLRAETNELVMCSGLGAILAEKHPAAASAFGKLIKAKCGDGGLYGVFCSNKVGLFQNSITPRHGVNLGVASESTKQLAEIALANPGKTYYLEAMWDASTPQFSCDAFIRALPENVIIWHT